MKRRARLFRWMMVVSTGIMPAFLLRCDKAALNFQREFFQGLGLYAAEAVFQQVLGIDVGGPNVTP